MQEVPAIPKKRKNDQQGYIFRGIDDIYPATNELFSKHGVTNTCDIVEKTFERLPGRNGGSILSCALTVRWEFVAQDGSSIALTTIGLGMDSGDKAANKAMTASHKYALIQLLHLPTEEYKDVENDSPEVIEQQAAKQAGIAKIKAVREEINRKLPTHGSQLDAVPIVLEYLDKEEKIKNELKKIGATIKTEKHDIVLFDHKNTDHVDRLERYLASKKYDLRNMEMLIAVLDKKPLSNVTVLVDKFFEEIKNHPKTTDRDILNIF